MLKWEMVLLYKKRPNVKFFFNSIYFQIIPKCFPRKGCSLIIWIIELQQLGDSVIRLLTDN